MNVTNVVFYFALMAVFVAEAAVLCKLLPLQRRLTAADRVDGRLVAVDGLRGILAPSVFLHHAALSFFFLRTGRWQMPSNFYAQMGVVPVTLFFFVTGYLFWSKLMKRPKLGFGVFLKDRLGRLGGAYLLACLMLFGFVMVESGVHRQVSWTRLLLEILGWLSFLGAGHDMNGLFDSKRLLGQVWTLRVEWLFYLSLPFLGWFARKRIRLPILLVGAALISLLVEQVNLTFSAPANYMWKTLGDYARVLFMTFSIGMLVAAIPFSDGLKAWARSWSAAVFSLLLLGITVMFVPPQHGWRVSVMLAVPFACVCLGNTWFGLLSLASVRSLGRVSYSFYLLHVFVLDAGIGLLSRFHEIASLAAWQYWMFAAACGMVTVFLSYLSYQFLEYPFLKKTSVGGAAVVLPKRQPGSSFGVALDHAETSVVVPSGL